MKKQIFGAVLAFSLGASLNSSAALMSNVNFNGEFALTGFNPTLDDDFNSFTYYVLGSNLTGNANIAIPLPADDATWMATGQFDAVAGPVSILPSIVLQNFLIGWTDLFNSSIAPGVYSYDFTNQIYTTTSGNFQFDIDSLPGSFIGSPTDLQLGTSLDVTYNILAQDINNVVC